MQTMITYKVAWVDSFGAIQEIDFDTEQDARDYATSVTNPVIYKIAMLGQIERLP